MEGSGSPKGASFGQLDDKVVNPGEPSALGDVPVAGADGGQNGGAPGPAATSVPGAPQVPPTRPATPQPQPQPQGPVDSIFLTELQEQKAHLRAIRVDNRIQHIVIGLCVVAAITYLTLQAKSHLPTPPVPKVSI